MELPLVVGVDGSAGSLQALDWAVDEAGRHDARLRVLYASLWERYESRLPPEDGLSAETRAEEAVAAAAARHAQERDPALRVHAETVAEEAVNALVEASRHAAAVVTGPSGRGTLAGLLLGSVSLSVAARAHCPVIVVRGTEENVRGTSGRILVGVGDAEEAPAAVRFAFREAAARGCEVHAVRAWRHPARQSVDHYPLPSSGPLVHEEQAGRELTEALRAAEAEHPHITVHGTTVEGPAHRALVDASADADLLVVGALRRHHGLGLQLGRVSHTALHRAECPVAVVPAG
ncbi:universal stress protein [Streptomyces sp. I05A-00742]|uniref:universal stress protein n=1 Tax=Streptomyces sp. I05A-00742 TaxID=2732853 RepID=UPI00148917C4|nr:universal stress protein [Streptomyces sp. I05A-00742]